VAVAVAAAAEAAAAEAAESGEFAGVESLLQPNQHLWINLSDIGHLCDTVNHQ
jgi:hypothetical protein